MTNSSSRHVRRSAHVIATWGRGARHVMAVGRGTRVPASALMLDVLDRLDTWVAVADLAADLELPPAALEMLLDGLDAHGLIETAPAGVVPPAREHAHIGPDAAPASSSAWTRWSPVARWFHEATRDVPFGTRPGTPPRPPDQPRPAIALPATDGPAIALRLPTLDDVSLARALRERRTHRRFGPEAIGHDALATLLGVTFGVQAVAHADEGSLHLKTSPSGGARHSLEAYVWVRRVEGVPSALYHYRPDDHVLAHVADVPAERAGLGEPAVPPGEPARRAPVTRWLPTQTGYDEASVVVVMASVLERVAWRYAHARAYRVLLIEAGHLGQTFCLTAAALGLAPFCTAALADSTIEADLHLDGETQPVVYAVGVGTTVDGPWRPHAGRPAPTLERTRLGLALDAAE
ncbi:MAG: nitroreductase family protein [Acidobacteria bacterium]|nr:nitroreductase family protein [Acidobacteriota bacterium]